MDECIEDEDIDGPKDAVAGRRGTSEAGDPRALPPSSQRQINWLQRGCKEPGSQPTWRPYKLYRQSARRWLDACEHQTQLLTELPGLSYFQPDWTLAIWKDWRLWPSATFVMDLGPDGNSAMWAMLMHWNLNVVQWADGSHGANRDFVLVLQKLGLNIFWCLMVTVWNLP